MILKLEKLAGKSATVKDLKRIVQRPEKSWYRPFRRQDIEYNSPLQIQGLNSAKTFAPGIRKGLTGLCFHRYQLRPPNQEKIHFDPGPAPGRPVIHVVANSGL